jgi:hypothetical protein
MSFFSLESPRPPPNGGWEAAARHLFGAAAHRSTLTMAPNP